MARPDGSPKDTAHEFFSLFMIIDENQSRYFDHNVKAHIADPATILRGEYTPLDPGGDGRPASRDRVRNKQHEEFDQWIPVQQWPVDDHAKRRTTCAGMS
jgi:hypothetical protein